MYFHPVRMNFLHMFWNYGDNEFHTDVQTNKTWDRSVDKQLRNTKVACPKKTNKRTDAENHRKLVKTTYKKLVWEGEGK